MFRVKAMHCKHVPHTSTHLEIDYGSLNKKLDHSCNFYCILYETGIDLKLKKGFFICGALLYSMLQYLSRNIRSLKAILGKVCHSCDNCFVF